MAIDAEALKLIGKRVREARRLSGLSQREFSAAIGISQSYLSEVERGASKPSIEIAIGVAEHCPYISLEWLLTGSGVIEKERREYIGGEMTRRVAILEAIFFHLENIMSDIGWLSLSTADRAHLLAVSLYRTASTEMEQLEAHYDLGTTDPRELYLTLRDRHINRLRQS